MHRYNRDPAISGYSPDAARLAAADTLHGWNILPSRTGDGQCLIGRDDEGRIVETADLLVLDTGAGYALTHAAGLWRLGARGVPITPPPVPLSAARQERRAEQILSALADRDRVRDGWRPGEAELSESPTLYFWSWGWHRGIGLRALDGQRVREARIGDLLTTSPVAVMHWDGHNGFARTWSRWYRLGNRHPDFGGHDNRAEFFESPVRPEAIKPMLAARYMGPPVSMEPTAELYQGDADEWKALWAWFEDRYGEAADSAAQVYLTLRTGMTPEEAYVHMDSWAKSMSGMRGHN